MARFERVTGSRLIKLFAPALLDQAMLPTISAALEDTGRLAHEPWQRAVATAASAQIMTAGHPADRLLESQRLLRLHRHIRGVTPTGLRYSAFAPQAWHWVLISTFRMQLAAYTALTGHHPDTSEQQVLWQHYRVKTAGLDLPGRARLADRYEEITAHYERMIGDTLARTPTLDTATETLLRAAPPPPLLPAAAEPAWRVIRPIVGQLAATLGLSIMHPQVRALVPMAWTRRHQVSAAVLVFVLRCSFRLLPAAVTDAPLSRNRRRYRALISRYRHHTTGSPDQPPSHQTRNGTRA
ncbi:oxygenase MpaB family protein [Nocardia sp. NPDC050435]|uniref:oxygenase MpaB family protein n=1 Tax=Nocardia sp. NPDC050435 TaxID=3155040 RepID=UPI00340747F2